VTDLILSEDETASNMLRITSHDYYTYTHSVNVGVTAIILAKELFRTSDNHNLHELGAGFFLHDLGKVNIDPAIINKPGRLTDAEMGQMRTHPYKGYKILQEADALSDECRHIVLEHHERHDGAGYPKGMKGDEIHLYGRICAVADVFDALTAERSYKQALGRYEALKLMKEQMLAHFHKDVFDAFVLLFK
jgi:HD-GYP domain-containing protein (c-di-GMP phosphodiesterase class II)